MRVGVKLRSACSIAANGSVSADTANTVVSPRSGPYRTRSRRGAETGAPETSRTLSCMSPNIQRTVRPANNDRRCGERRTRLSGRPGGAEIPVMAYDLSTQSPGVIARHADRCPARGGGRCTCGPLGFRAQRDGRAIGPMMETEAQARAYAGDQVHDEATPTFG